VVTICKTILRGSTPEQIRDQADGLAPAELRELAACLAEDPDLTISVITYADGRRELEVLHTGSPHRTENTIDRRKFTRQPRGAQARTLSITTPADLEDAIALVRSILLHAAASLRTQAQAGRDAIRPPARYAHAQGGDSGPAWGAERHALVPVPWTAAWLAVPSPRRLATEASLWRGLGS